MCDVNKLTLPYFSRVIPSLRIETNKINFFIVLNLFIGCYISQTNCFISLKDVSFGTKNWQ